MARRGVPLSCAHDNVPHVSQGCGDEDYLRGTGEPFAPFLREPLSQPSSVLLSSARMQLHLCSTSYSIHVRSLVSLQHCVWQCLHFLFGIVAYVRTTHPFGINLNDLCCVDNLLCCSLWYCMLLSNDQQGFKPPNLDSSITLRTVIPIGFATAGDILLSNLSFMVSTVSFYTIVKSGSLMW